MEDSTPPLPHPLDAFMAVLIHASHAGKPAQICRLLGTYHKLFKNHDQLSVYDQNSMKWLLGITPEEKRTEIVLAHEGWYDEGFSKNKEEAIQEMNEAIERAWSDFDPLVFSRRAFTVPFEMEQLEKCAPSSKSDQGTSYRGWAAHQALKLALKGNEIVSTVKGTVKSGPDIFSQFLGAVESAPYRFSLFRYQRDPNNVTDAILELAREFRPTPERLYGVVRWANEKFDMNLNPCVYAGSDGKAIISSELLKEKREEWDKEFEAGGKKRSEALYGDASFFAYNRRNIEKIEKKYATKM